VSIPQHQARLLGQLFDQEFGDPVVRDVRGGESGAKRYPYTGYGGGEVELPTVHPHPCQPDLPHCASVSIEV
jgi:hypothetical protein